MPDFRIVSLRGGLNNSDPPTSLPDDQCTVASNVEWVESMLGERRRGCDAITVTGGLVGHDKVPFLFRHLPTNDESEAELWALGVTGTSSAALVRKTTSWGTVTIGDTATLTGVFPFRWQAVSLHGKLFLAYKSNVSRLHVADGAGATALRRVGMAAPGAAPTGANDGSGTFAGTRYYRVREVVLSGSVVLRRSEPSAVLTFSPSGSGTGVVVTKPADAGESATHWELEASTDNANFYRIARTVVATTTVTDTTALVPGYASATGAVLSEDVGDYTLIGSARYLIADEDRLVFGGDYEDTSRASRVGWTPVYNADGVGNDERIELDTDPTLDLDGFEGGPLTGLSKPVNGAFLAFKFSHTYKLVRSGKRTRAYEVFNITKERGALHGSVVEGVDQMGRPCVYALDPEIGPWRYGSGGPMACGEDIRETWATLNVNATQVVCVSLYDRLKRQVHWWIATGNANVPDTHIVLQVNLTREAEDGVRRGWSIWTGPSAAVLSACLFSDNIDAGIARNRTLRPFYGMTGNGLIWRGDTGSDDNGTAYEAQLITKPYTPFSSILHHVEVKSGALLATAMANASIDVQAIRDCGLEAIAVPGVAFDPTGVETQVIKALDDLSFSELRTLQIEFVDVASPGGRWELNELALRIEGGQRA